MKHIVTLLLLLGIINAVPAQTKKSPNTPVITRYYQFTGTIDKYPVTFHLYRNNNDIEGHYYYNSTEEPMSVSGKLEKGNFLKLTRTDREGSPIEVLSGNFKDTSFSGTWSSKGKLLPFRVAQKPDNNGLAFDYIYTSGAKKIAKDDNSREEVTYEAASIWPAASSNHAATNLIKSIIFDAFGSTMSQEPIGKIMISEKNEILNPRKNEEGTTYALDRTVKVEHSSMQLLTISAFTYADNGGAHGNYGTSYTTIDLVHNRKLNVTDVLDTMACKSTLQTLLEKKFRHAYSVPKEEKLAEWLFKDAISPNNNIMVTSKGIAFNYMPYEIAAYALGEVYLYIPFKELTGCLTEDFKKLVGIPK